MPDTPPTGPADHAEVFAHLWADRLDEYCTVRMAELGIPDQKYGEANPHRPNPGGTFGRRSLSADRPNTCRMRLTSLLIGQ